MRRGALIVLGEAGVDKPQIAEWQQLLGGLTRVGWSCTAHQNRTEVVCKKGSETIIGHGSSENAKYRDAWEQTEEGAESAIDRASWRCVDSDRLDDYMSVRCRLIRATIEPLGSARQSGGPDSIVGNGSNRRLALIDALRQIRGQSC